MRRARLSTRLALASAVCALAAVIAFGIMASIQITQGEYRRLDLSLMDRARVIADAINSNSLGQRSGDSVSTPVQVWGQESKGGPLVRQNLNGSNSPDLPAPGETDVGVNRSYLGTPFRVLDYPVHPQQDASLGLSPTVVRVGEALGGIEGEIDQARTRLMVGGGVALAMAVVLTLLAARHGLRPIDKVQTAAEYVADNDDLAVRVEEEGPPEVRALAGSMNRMLERLSSSQEGLQVALEEQRRFAQDASHELRTPLTAIRGHLDMMGRYELPEEDRKAIVQEMSEATDRMRRLVEGLLALARTDGRARTGEEIQLAETLREVASVEGEGPFLEDADQLVTLGDREQVRGIFANLVDNGRRYGGSVRVTGRREGDWAVVEVTDQGPGIAPEDRERVFDRFYRAPGLRSTPGSGLGLAIARQAVTRLGGSLRLLDSPRGARFEVRLPIAATPAPAAARPPGVAQVEGEDDRPAPRPTAV